MSEKLRESLSAAIDGEADEFELRRVLDEISKDPTLKNTWGRFHDIGAVVRGESIASSSTLSQRVWDALDMPEESDLAMQPAALAAIPEPRRRWLGRLIGGGIAAAVALAVMLVVNQNQTDSLGNIPSTLVAEANSQPTLEIQGPIYQLGTEASALDTQRVNAYKMHHIQQQALNNPGVVSFVKVVTYQDKD